VTVDSPPATTFVALPVAFLVAFTLAFTLALWGRGRTTTTGTSHEPPFGARTPPYGHGAQTPEFGAANVRGGHGMHVSTPAYA
jgi:hypothetical protein